MSPKILWREVLKIVFLTAVISGIILLAGFYFSIKSSFEGAELHLYYPQSLLLALTVGLIISVAPGLKKFKIQQSLNSLITVIFNAVATCLLSYLLFLLSLVILVFEEAISNPANAANFGWWLVALNLSVPLPLLLWESEFLPFTILFLVIFLGTISWLVWRLLKEKKNQLN